MQRIDNNFSVMDLYMIQKIKESLPIDDIMAWLIQTYPQAELKEILYRLNVIYQEGFVIHPAAEVQNTYRIGEQELTAFPQRVVAREASS